jgi:hypothetical protein
VDAVKWPKNQMFTEYVQSECLRQISAMDMIASSLSTKTSLYMVFAAFTFGVELQLAHNAECTASGLISGAAMIFCLIAVVCLLGSSSLREFGMPPRATAFQQESILRFAQLVKNGKSEEDALLVLQEKYINSVARSVEKNHAANMKTVNMLGWASGFLLASIICLFFSAVLVFAPYAWKAVRP